MTLALAGTFTPTQEMFALAERANALVAAFFERVKHALRPGVDVHDAVARVRDCCCDQASAIARAPSSCAGAI